MLTLAITLPLLVQENFSKTKAFCQAILGVFRWWLPFLRKAYEMRSGNEDLRRALAGLTQEPRKIGLM